MRINEAIATVDAVKINTYPAEIKVGWLNTLDGIIKREVIDTHEGGEDIVFNGYTNDTPGTTELLVPAPYSEIYIRYLEMQIDYANGEFSRYNNSSEVFNEAYEAFKKHYNRTHMPKGTKFKFF